MKTAAPMTHTQGEAQKLLPPFSFMLTSMPLSWAIASIEERAVKNNNEIFFIRHDFSYRYKCNRCAVIISVNKSLVKGKYIPQPFFMNCDERCGKLDTGNYL